MKKVLSICLFLAFGTVFSFGSRIDQGSTDSGHTLNCTQSNPFPTSETNPCVFFDPTTQTIDQIAGVFDGDNNLISQTQSVVDDVYTQNGSLNNSVVFTATGPLASATYGVLLCGDGTKDGAIGNATMSGTLPCVNLTPTNGEANGLVSTNYFMETDSGNMATITANLNNLDGANALTNDTLVFFVHVNANDVADGTFAPEQQSSGVPEPSSIFLLLTGGIGALATRIRTAKKK